MDHKASPHSNDNPSDDLFSVVEGLARSADSMILFVDQGRVHVGLNTDKKTALVMLRSAISLVMRDLND